MGKLQVSALYHYPLKSARGIALNQAQVTPYGLEQDRRWMVVDSKGRFLSQRRFPSMALIESQPLTEGLQLQAPGMPPLMVPDAPGTPMEIRIWGYTDKAQDLGDQAAAWLSAYLQFQCRLVTLGPDFQRPVDPDYDHWESQVGFADGFPFLLISEASLEGLNARLDVPVPMNRFRPNIVVSGCRQAHEEDDWRALQIGELRFHAVKPCSRCTVPTIDQDSAQRGPEPTQTLSEYRRGEDKQIYFGQNLVHETKSGVLRVGDSITVLD